MNEIIKPCPFCGGEAFLYKDCADPYEAKEVVLVRCKMCGASGKPFDIKDDPEKNDWNTPESESAVLAWNLRRNAEYEDLMKSVLEAIADLKTLFHPEEVKE